MASIDKRVVAAVLTTLRARREEPSVSQPQVPVGSAPATAKLREAHFSDFEAVAELKRRWGLAADSLENWERLWRHNPALALMGPERPIGWVLEAEGRIVGYVGNISMLYRYGERTLTSVTSHAFVVDPPYRAIGVSLIAAYYRQKAVDLFISTGAIAPVGKIAQAFKSEVLLQGEEETVLFWVLQPYAFAKAVMRKLRFTPPISNLGGSLGSVAVGADKMLHRRWPRQSTKDLSTVEISIGEIGDDFQDFWIEKVNEKTELLADRTPAALRWHFEVPGDKGSVRVLGCSKNGKLVGYAVIRNEPPDETGLRKSIIADILAKEDDAAIVQALFAAAYRHAQQAGSHMLEVLGFPASIRRILGQAHPYIRKYPTRLFGYKATDPILHKTLSDGTTWYATPFDGDFTLIRPSYSPSTP
jgi:hypothetical protein